jgi:hypothetical protein
MRSRATAARAAPPVGILISILLHAGLVIALFISFSKKLDLPAEAGVVVPVDLVTLGDQTNIAPTRTADAPQTETPEPPKPDVAPPQPEAEAAPQVQPQPRPRTDADRFNPDDILRLLAHKRQPNARVAARAVESVGAGTAMTADLAALMQSLIYRCWSPPVGGPHPERQIVRYELFLNRDGSVAQAPQLAPETAAAAASDPYMAAAVGAARRAIYMCAPYRLPAEKYQYWRDVMFTFDPRQNAQ